LNEPGVARASDSAETEPATTAAERRGQIGDPKKGSWNG